MAITGVSATFSPVGSDTDATSYVTSSITPTSNTLQLVSVLNSRSGATATTPTLSGCGLTWVQVATVTWSSDQANLRRATVFRAMGASPSAGALTIDFGGVTQTGCQWEHVEFTSVDTSGTNGSGAVVQSNTAASDTVTVSSLSVSLSAFASANNRTFAAVGHSTNEGKTPRASWTELRDPLGTFGTPTQNLQTEWSDAAGADTTASASWATASRAGIIALEIAASPGAQYDAQSSKDFTLSTTFTHTPVGTPKGVLLLIAQNSSTDVITAASYGGVAMTRVATNGFAADTVGEPGAAYAYFLGASIPTGAQTVSITTADGNDKTAWCFTVTADVDTQLAGSGTASGDAANPSATLSTIAGFVGFVGAVLFSGQNAPASVTAGTGYTLATATRDFGNTSAVAERSDTRTGASVAAGFTATSEDVALIGVAVEEVASSSNDTVTGVRALATAAAKAGTPKVSLLGVRGAASAAAKPGTPKVTILGVRALASATGKPGTPKLILAPGIRAAATAAGKAGSPKVSILGVRALATAAGKPGTTRKDCNKTGVRAAATAAGKPGTAKVCVTGVRAAATAAGKPGTPKVAVTGARALATAAGKTGTVTTGANKAVTGVRATATARGGGADATSFTQAQLASTTSINLGDGFLLAKGMLFSNSIGRSFIRWPDPLDLATFDTVALANDGKHNGSVGMFFDATTDLVYVCPLGYLGGDDFWHILIFTVDPDSLAVADFVDIQLYDSNIYAIGPGAGNICTDGTSLYVITHTNATFGPDTQVRKYLLADGSLTATRTITGFQHGHPIAYDAATNTLYGGGTSPAGTGWAFSMPADLSSHSTVQVAASGCTVCDDIVIYGGYFWLQDETKSNPARVFRVKKDLSSVDTISLTSGGTSAVCDGFLDNTANDGTIWVGMRGGDKIAVVNATTLVEGTALSTSGVTAINEILRSGSSVYIATYEGTSKVARYVLAAAAGDKGTPKVCVTGVRALATAAGKPGTVSTGTGSTNATVTGVRAAATAAAKAGTPKVAVTGSRAAATATGKPGTPRVAVTGVRGAATAAAKPGTPKLLVAGARATATAAGTVGSPKVSILGVRAAASAAGRAGTPKVCVTAVRALATAAGKAGSTSAPGNKAITGVRATASAAGKPGTPKVAVTGTRGAATAAGKPGTPKVCVTGVRALASAAGKFGSTRKDCNKSGTRAAAGAAAKAGTPKISVSGARAAATAAGRSGTPKVLVVGSRALATATGKTGTVHTANSVQVIGVRCLAHAFCYPGSTASPATAELTRRTQTSGPSAVTILATDAGRTVVSTAGSRTRVGVTAGGARVSVRTSRTRTETPPVGED